MRKRRRKEGNNPSLSFSEQLIHNKTRTEKPQCIQTYANQSFFNKSCLKEDFSLQGAAEQTSQGRNSGEPQEETKPWFIANFKFWVQVTQAPGYTPLRDSDCVGGSLFSGSGAELFARGPQATLFLSVVLNRLASGDSIFNDLGLCCRALILSPGLAASSPACNQDPAI